jgi:hypothetical protein
MNKNKTTWKFYRLPIAVFMVISFLGCIAAIPVAIKYYEEKENYVAKADLPAPAQKVYEAAVSMAKEKAVKIVEKDNKKFYLKVKDGKQTASLKAVPVGSDKAQIIVTASIPESKERKEAQKDLVFRIMHNVCTKLNVKYTIEQQ